MRFISALVLVPSVLAGCSGHSEFALNSMPLIQLVEIVCEFEIECEGYDPRPGDCIVEDPKSLTSGDPMCDDASRELLECLAGLDSCAELDAYYEEPYENYPCAAEDERVYTYCW